MYRAELLKLRTTRTPWIIGAVAVAGMLLTQLLTLVLPRTLRTLEALSGSDAGFQVGVQMSPADTSELLSGLAAATDLGSATAQRALLDLMGNGPAGSGSSGVTALCLLLLGVLAATTDFRTGGIVPTVLAVPDRLRVLAGKAGATATAALAIGVALALVTAVGLVVAVATTPGASLAIGPGEALGVWARGLAVMVLLSWLGLAVGTLVRGQVAAIVVVVALALVEPMVQAAALVLTGGATTATSWLPITLGSLASAGQGAVQLFGAATDATAGVGAAAALAGLLAWAAVLLVAAGAVFRRRDLA
jgi:ABC-2 type transport system permease protein